MSALVVARLAAVLPHWRITAAHPLDLLRVTDGLSLPGGVAGALGGLVVFAWRARLPIPAVADLYGMVLPLGVAAHGVGCLLRDDCYGRAAPPPFGIVFPGLRTPRYPVELYAAALALLAYGGLHLLRQRRLPVGGLAAGAIAMLATSRLALDTLRLDASDRLLSDDQIVSLVMAALAAAMLTLLWLRTRGYGRPVALLGRMTTPGVADRR